MNKIIIKGLKIFAFHGVNPEEKDEGQEFELDITMLADISSACKNDDLTKTINYAKAAKIIIRAMTEKKFNLIEKAGDYVAENLMREFDMLQEVTILLKKPNAPMKATFDYVAVEISRKRSDYIE